MKKRSLLFLGIGLSFFLLNVISLGVGMIGVGILLLIGDLK